MPPRPARGGTGLVLIAVPPCPPGHPGNAGSAFRPVQAPSLCRSGSAIWQKRDVVPGRVYRMAKTKLLVRDLGNADPHLGDVARLVRLQREAQRTRIGDDETIAATGGVDADRAHALASAHARRTTAAARIVLMLGHGAGGETAGRLLGHLGIPLSGDTVLRHLERLSLRNPGGPPLRVVGVDDFAWRKGSTYGTIFVDRETHTVADVCTTHHPRGDSRPRPAGRLRPRPRGYAPEPSPGARAKSARRSGPPDRADHR